MFEAGQQRAREFGVRFQVPAYLHDARDGLARLPEKFQAHRARIFWHAMQNPTRGGDQPVAALLLHARQPTQEFIGNVLAQSNLAKLPWWRSEEHTPELQSLTSL